MGRWLRPLWIGVVVGCAGPAQVDPPACTACHGTPGNAAPPVALGGDEDAPAVGAHQAHIAPAQSAPVACEECHLVPSEVDEPGHVDSALPAEVVWGPLASQAGADAFDAVNQTCTVYCHGAGFADPSVPPGWNDGADAVACDSCHGFPPPPPHPGSAACGDCHPTPSAETHIDGTVQLGSR